MRVSVVIPNYNYAQFLPLAIDSLLNQTEKPDEIIVIDDGSTDNSREVLEAYGDKITAVFQQNGGQASAISNGFARATGDIVCILDSDDVFFPDKIRILKETYAGHPRANWVFHTLQHMSPVEAGNLDGYPKFEKGVSLRRINQISAMRRGKLGYDAPATSGLSFRRNFISGLFPLPAAESIYISDHYIKFFAIAKGEGINIVEAIGGQIIHGNNLYTGAKALATRARIFANTGYFLFLAAPEVKRFCTNLIIEALICAKKAEISNQVEVVAGKYIQHLSRREFFYLKLKIAMKLILKNIH